MGLAWVSVRNLGRRPKNDEQILGQKLGREARSGPQVEEKMNENTMQKNAEMEKWFSQHV